MTKSKMTVRAAAAAFVLTAIFEASALAAAGGGTFDVEVKEGAKHAFKDRLIVTGDTFESLECRKYGFAPARYNGSAATFLVSAKSAKEGAVQWKGTINADQIEGTLDWTNGGKTSKYTFTGKKLPSLYDRLGGTYAIATVVDEFIERLLVDDMLNANPKIRAARDRVPKAGLKYRVTALVSQVTGGPEQYTGRSMKEAHAHLDISEKEWDELVRVFVSVLDKYKVPKAEQDELLGIVGSTKGDIVTKK
jgi:hemoglobin